MPYSGPQVAEGNPGSGTGKRMPYSHLVCPWGPPALDPRSQGCFCSLTPLLGCLPLVDGDSEVRKDDLPTARPMQAVPFPTREGSP